MCLFSYPAKGKAVAYGIEEFTCGHCPECLQKKSSVWALRCSMESRVNYGVMVTLTYDTYKYFNSFEENETDPTIPLSKKHCQDFIKRLRKHFEGQTIKYILTAERGKRTGRAHYHALLFGVKFDDLQQYKKSKRGNVIYKSKTLEKIWKHGICTVDCINLSAKVARYCTKYCAKDYGVDDTFMLFSRGIGQEELRRRFNGKSYWIDGREYTIPKDVWKWYIENKYNIHGYSRYVNKLHVERTEELLVNAYKRYDRRIKTLEKENALKEVKYEYWRLRERYYEKKAYKARKMYTWHKYNQIADRFRAKYEYVDKLNERKLEALETRNRNVDKRIDDLQNRDIPYNEAQRKREIYSMCRDNDEVYQRYIEYWRKKSEVIKKTKPSCFERILRLPKDKYNAYKQRALIAHKKRVLKQEFIPPRSKTQAFLNDKEDRRYREKSFASQPRHNTANDTTKITVIQIQMDFPRYLQIKTRIFSEDMEKFKEKCEFNPFKAYCKRDKPKKHAFKDFKDQNLSEICGKKKKSTLTRLTSLVQYAKIK